jgi:hypothetical protein
MRRRRRSATRSWSLRGAGLLGGLLLGAAFGVDARIAELEVSERSDHGVFDGVAFERLEGRLVGELDPATEPLPGLDQVAADARGRVVYRSSFTIIAPRDPAHDSGTLVFDVINRGRNISHGLYNSTQAQDPLERGNGFLQRQRFSLASTAWELGQGIELPEFVDAAGSRRYVEGVGLAAVRDLVDFLRHADADDTGRSNPLRGRIQHAIGVGYSQTGRFLRTLLAAGYDTAEGRRVFDGMHVQAGHAGLVPILSTGYGPGSSVTEFPRFDTPDFPGVHVEPLTWRDILARVRERSETPPKIVVTNMGQDYLALRTSLSRTGARGTQDLPIPEEVRIYDVAGAPHGLLPIAQCDKPRGELDFRPVMRAVLLHLDRWVRGEAEPPASVLLALEPRPDDPELLQAPSYLPDAVVQAPRRDVDGNHLGGVRLPELVVPLAAHGSQNRPLDDPMCMLVGATSPFARNRREREAHGDPRPSVAERYAGRDDYVLRIRSAARALVQQGFLLEEDVERIVARVQLSPVFDSDAP